MSKPPFQPNRRRFVSGFIAPAVIGVAGCITPDEWLLQDSEEDHPNGNHTEQEPPENPEPSEPAEPPSDPSPPEVDPARLARYTNSPFSYSVLYPDHWSVDESDPALVQILPEEDIGGQYLHAFSSEEALSVEALRDQFVEMVRETAIEYEVTAERNITTPSGQTGLIYEVDSRYDQAPVREKVAVVPVESVNYACEVYTVAEVYTDEVDRVADMICESLTIFA